LGRKDRSFFSARRIAAATGCNENPILVMQFSLRALQVLQSGN
jgi:hypothetical protein